MDQAVHKGDLKPTQELIRSLRLACLKGDAFVVGTLLAKSCDVNCVDSGGFTPLMYAAVKDHEEVVKKLILAGANLDMQNANSDTALHLAATYNSIQCGILLAEGGASVRTKNNLAQTPLDLAKAEFKEAIKEALSFTTRKTLCIIGNACREWQEHTHCSTPNREQLLFGQDAQSLQASMRPSPTNSWH